MLNVEKQCIRYGAVGCIFKDNKTVELSNECIEHADIFLRYCNSCVLRVTVVAHYLRNGRFRRYQLCLNRKWSLVHAVCICASCTALAFSHNSHDSRTHRVLSFLSTGNAAAIYACVLLETVSTSLRFISFFFTQKYRVSRQTENRTA